MTQILRTEQKAAIESSNLVMTRLVLFALASGNHGFWFGKGQFVWNSITWIGSDRLIEIEDSGETIGLGANGKTIRLRENAGLGLTATVLATIHSESYLNSEVLIWDAFFDNATGNISGLPLLDWTGRLRPCRTKGPEGKRYIEAQCEHQNFDNTRRNFTMANSAHHALVAPGDRFFDYCGVSATTAIYFGQPTPSAWNFQTNRLPQ